MIRRRLSFVIIYLVFFSCLAIAQPDSTFHIYLMFGQSNMEGNGTIEPQDRVTHPRVFVLQDSTCPNLGREYGKWYIAEPPLARCWGRLGPGDSFGRMMGMKAPSWVTKIGLVNVSVGGCNIFIFKKGCPNGLDQYSQGIPFNCGYTWLLDLARKASEKGVIKGILFHQGETNNTDPNWKYTVQQIVSDLKTDLGLGDIPFLAGEMLYGEYGSCCSAHNIEVNKLPGLIPNTHVISAAGLPGADYAHFTSASYRTFGERYAQKMLKLVYNICDSTPVESWYAINGGPMNKSNMIIAHHGTNVKLSPRPSNLLGTWNWSGAGTSGSSREQTIQVPNEGIHTALVTYTNECGSKSRIPVTIKVCDSTQISSWYQIEDGPWIMSDSISVLRYSDLTIRTTSADSTGTWNWSGAGLSGSLTEQKPNTSIGGKFKAVATYTNQCGSQSRVSVSFRVCDSTRIQSWYQVDDDPSIQSDSISVFQNSTLKLTPKPLSGGSWSWSGALSGSDREQIINTQIPGTYMAFAAFTNDCGLISHMKVKLVIEGITATDAKTDTDKPGIFPNPSKSTLNIKLPGASQINSGMILNEAGQTIMNLMIKPGNQQVVDISELKPGVYYIRLVTRDQIWVSKFVRIP